MIQYNHVNHWGKHLPNDAQRASCPSASWHVFHADLCYLLHFLDGARCPKKNWQPRGTQLLLSISTGFVVTAAKPHDTTCASSIDMCK